MITAVFAVNTDGTIDLYLHEVLGNNGLLVKKPFTQSSCNFRLLKGLKEIPPQFKERAVNYNSLF